MTPAARIQAAIEILDRVLAGDPAEAALIRWARNSRFAGSGDRAGVRDLVFDSLRRRNTRAALGGRLDGRGLMLGMCRELGLDAGTIFTGQGHAPAVLTPAEEAGGREPDPDEMMDLPEWLLPVWRSSLGPQAQKVAEMMRDRAPVWLRANQNRAETSDIISKLRDEGIECTASALLPTALLVTEGGRKIAASKAYRDGLVELQDLSAQLACSSLPWAGRILDYCAGGGGKALALAAAGAKHITAHDVDFGRMRDLPVRAERAKAKIKLVQPGQVRGSFDLVMADVPCSGSGTWRRTPDAKWRLTSEMLAGLLQTQAQILSQTAALVAKGGYLAYMTCSLLEDENSMQINGFLQKNPEFRTVVQRRYSPLVESDGFYLHLLQRD